MIRVHHGTGVRLAALVLAIGLSAVCAAAAEQKPEAASPAPELKQIEVNDTRVEYLEEGGGPVVLLISPGVLPPVVWKEIQRRLSQSFRVIAIDPNGMLTPATDDSSATQQLLQNYRAFMDAMGIRAAHLVGASVGGGIAVALAHHFPEKALTATSSGGFEGAGWLTDIEARLHQVAPRSKREVRDLLSSTTVRYRGGQAPEDLIDALAQPLVGRQADRMVRRFTTSTLSDIRSGFIATMTEYVEAPVLLLAGDQDRMRPPEWNDRARAAIGDVTFVPVANAGHLAFLDQPEQVATAITQFIQEKNGTDWVKRHFGF